MKLYLYALTTMLVALVFITPKDNLNLCMETEAELLHRTLNEIKQLEESNNLFNFYAKEKIMAEMRDETL
jgi:hypothetical protein